MMKRMRIVNEARTWLGTPFKHQGRVKGIGVDCLGLVAGVFKSLSVPSKTKDSKGGFVPLHKFDQTGYSTNPDGHTLQEVVSSHLDRKPLGDYTPGDIVLMKWMRYPQHLAIVSDYPGGEGIIHSYRSAGKCVEHNLSEDWEKLIVEAYEVPW